MYQQEDDIRALAKTMDCQCGELGLIDFQMKEKGVTAYHSVYP